MTAPVDALIADQWATLRAWVERPDVLAHLDQPSVLDGWTVADLIAHVGRSFTTLAGVEPADGIPLTLRAYVATYPDAADEIAEGTRTLAAELSTDLLPGIDRLAADGLARLAALNATVVRARRGLISRDDFAMTRLVEVVVHADDLARSVTVDAPSPLLAEAVVAVSDALSDAYLDATGNQNTHGDGIAWIRLAAGRTASDDPALPLL